jgi:heme O synthase-like polyprenyltransferase
MAQQPAPRKGQPAIRLNRRQAFVFGVALVIFAIVLVAIGIAAQAVFAIVAGVIFLAFGLFFAVARRAPGQPPNG